MEVVRIEKVSKSYKLGNQHVQAVRNIDLTVTEGDLLAIAGPSGSGKSTLLNLIGCIDSPSSGNIVIAGENVANRTPNQLADLRAKTIGFIFQTFNLLPVLSAEENVEYPLLQLKDITKNERRERVRHFLNIVPSEPAEWRSATTSRHCPGLSNATKNRPGRRTNCQFGPKDRRVDP